jgi:hypothetical protein
MSGPSFHSMNFTYSASRLISIVAAGLMLGLSGCATVTRGTHEALVIESDPSGALVQLSNGMSGTTPTSFKIKRKGAVDVTISKAGYETLHVHVTTQVAGAGAAGMAGNVLVGGLIGAGVDALSGGMLEHKPNPVQVKLVPIAPAASEKAATATNSPGAPKGATAGPA